MAGLQQYNFFPTDLLYPRPPPSAVPAAAVLPLQHPKQETSSDVHLQNQPIGLVHVPPSTSSALVISCKPQSPIELDKKLSQLSTDPLSLHSCVTEEEGSDSSGFPKD